VAWKRKQQLFHYKLPKTAFYQVLIFFTARQNTCCAEAATTAAAIFLLPVWNRSSISTPAPSAGRRCWAACGCCRVANLLSSCLARPVDDELISGFSASSLWTSVVRVRVGGRYDWQACVMCHVLGRLEDRPAIFPPYRSFAVAGPCLWNSLPLSLRKISSYGQFRRYLKNHLFGIGEITAQCDAWYSALYNYSYLLTYLLT